jgi:hypothetical protein
LKKQWFDVRFAFDLLIANRKRTLQKQGDALKLFRRQIYAQSGVSQNL